MAVEKYLEFLEEQDREDSEERAANRGETIDSNELFVIKEEIPVPHAASTGRKDYPHHAFFYRAINQ